MILFIICIVLFAAGTIAIVIDAKTGWEWSGFAEFFIMLTAAIGISGAIIIGTFGIVHNSGPYVDTKMIEYEETVNELKASRKLIDSITDDYARAVAVVEYNKSVSEFKSNILIVQRRLDNLMINWTQSIAYKYMDANAVDYISEVGG